MNQGFQRILLGMVALLIISGVGCVRRRLTVRSNPPGALVYIDGTEIGRTPVSTGFRYYGTREIRLVSDGYETLTVKQNVMAPWYDVPGVDFITENFIAQELRDERVLDFQLTPQKIVTTDELLQRAQRLRDGARTGLVTPLPAGVLPAEDVLPALPLGQTNYPTSAGYPRQPASAPIPGSPEFQQPSTVPQGSFAPGQPRPITGNLTSPTPPTSVQWPPGVPAPAEPTSRIALP